MKIDKVVVGGCRCACHSHYVRREDGGKLVAVFHRHEGGKLVAEKEILKPGEPLHQKAEALFLLHETKVSPDEAKEILIRYGRRFKTFRYGAIRSNYIGATTVDGAVVRAGDTVFVSGDKITIQRG